ncbi:PaaI family thioesterase [Caenimonas sedimenti]|nr:hotdog domain-containing protein [Caenimonas sedimenti]
MLVTTKSANLGVPAAARGPPSPSLNSVALRATIRHALAYVAIGTEGNAMHLDPIPFRLAPDARSRQLSSFNDRAEIRWFGFRGQWVEPGWAEIEFERIEAGALGGGGVDAINGGVIAAGFDAAFVLAGLGHYDSKAVVTLELSVQFLSLARAAEPLAFRAGVTKSSRGFAFAQGALLARRGGAPFATASAMIAPASAPRAAGSYAAEVADQTGRR